MTRATRPTCPTRTTPARPVDVEQLFPELAPYRREALRLHPRPGAPTARDSSVGGPLLWPAEESWPVCTEEHYEPESPELHEAGVALLPIVQVRRAEAPGVPFPEGTDLLQVLWCPYGHGEYCYPLPRVYWRDSAAVGKVRPTPDPDPGLDADWYPDPCTVHPETVTEYASRDLPWDLQDALRGRIDELEAETGLLYPYHLADAPGIKLGGWPGWTQEPVWPDCEGCGSRMEHLLTVASREFDGESWRTWLPVEDRNPDGGDPDWHLAASAGLCLGDVGGVYVFECRTCPDRPVGHWFDCS
ncbi:DUF1963 domain-containing protein [Streptomyces sp. NPDC046866]|uniref:DUF1963 domain-containing protein n=1 Tax=Streptomyces sp. NPDC046866 TaxID=3154921 RepID=UPI003455EA43